MEIPKPCRQIWVDGLHIKIYTTRKEMGLAAASDASQSLQHLAMEKDTIRMIFAAAPSQNEFLECLINEGLSVWNKVEAFHMDEYIGLPEDHPQRFGNFLKYKLFDKLPFKQVHYLHPDSSHPEAAVLDYEALIRARPADLVALGIGENTHIAFNDPPVADFNDPRMVKVVALDDDCKHQQVHDGCFPSVQEVPPMAVTLTVPALFSGKKLICIVPGERKSRAVYQTLTEKISEKHPATILRKHPNATLYLDKDAAKLIM